MAGIIVNKIAETQNMGLDENLDPDTELGAYEWRRLPHGGHWNGKILVQLTCIAELTWLFRRAQGRGICSDGHRATLDISSPTRISLAAELSVRVDDPAGGVCCMTGHLAPAGPT